MSCQSCRLGNQVELSAEMMLHLGGLKNLDNSGVWLFPKVSVCLDCGSARFTVTEAALRSLAATPTSERLTMAAAG